ncbi:uncharacterized ATP-dependent helicase YprA [Arthrobacter sp. Hiyo4]|nr:uncharacterized ATP-dependent helicase YprA [Arthrobacter sp. Hiyo4]
MSIVDADTGSLLGTMDSPQTHYQAHTGAIYVHQGDSYVVEDLNEDDHCVVVRRANPDYYTTARDVTQIEVLETLRTEHWGDVALHFGDVKVTTQVVSFQRKALISNEILGEEPLELGARDLFTKAVWFVVENRSLTGAGLIAAQFPGALHAAEHAAIGLLPLVASSDRWDIGGVSTAIHADTGVPTIFVYDGHPGGAGFAERGFDKAKVWLSATRDAIKACECESGCPSCVQSPNVGTRTIRWTRLPPSRSSTSSSRTRAKCLSAVRNSWRARNRSAPQPLTAAVRPATDRLRRQPVCVHSVPFGP